jgi:hypothetical protein
MYFTIHILLTYHLKANKEEQQSKFKKGISRTVLLPFPRFM